MIRVLLVDDEPMANTTLRHLLKAFPSVEVAGVCTEPEAALEFCATQPVDAVFLDIEMPRVKGMELADKIRSLLPEVRLVFVTAYPDYALRAFDISALDYLLKPVGRDRLACTIDRLERQTADSQADAQAAPGQWIVGKSGSRVCRLLAEDILFLVVEERRTFAVTEQEKVRVTGSLSHWRAELPPQRFFRCHGSYLVNLEKIVSIEPGLGKSWSLRLAGCAAAVPVSRYFIGPLRDILRM